MLPMTSSTIRSWREAEAWGLRQGKRRRGAGAGPSQLVPPTPPEASEQVQEEGLGRGRYHVERPAALPDAVCVEHVEDAPANPRVCKEKGRCPLFPTALACASREDQGPWRPQLCQASSSSSPSDSSRPPVRGQNPKVSCDPGPQGHQALIPWGPAGPFPTPSPSFQRPM